MNELRALILFPVLAVLVSLVALLMPAPFIALKSAIVPLLSVVMFGMGLTLTPANFVEVLQRPGIIALGLLLQFLVMPVLAWQLTLLLQLPLGMAAGVILVGCCPGGTASNVICYLARGDVALSITLTACSTLLAVILTPMLTWWIIGERVPVDSGSMLISIAQMVLLPVCAGVVLNYYAGAHLSRFKAMFPWMSIIAIVFIIAVIVGLNAGRAEQLIAALILVVALHNGLGMLLAWLLARGVGCQAITARTLAIEVGMQNSGLAVALATQYFTASAALPGALYSVWHNLSGSIMAAFWRRSEGGEMTGPKTDRS